MLHPRTPRRWRVLRGVTKLRQVLDCGDAVKRSHDAGIDNDAEVDAAKNEQAFVEGRIRELELILSNARIIEEDRVWETVEIGAKVVIQENGTEPEKYTIVGAAEANPRNGFISNESPLGKALMGHKVGDVITVDAPNGKFTVTLVKVG